MDYKKYYKEVRAQKQIDKLAKKYKNKKIVIYGAGIMANDLFEDYNLSDLDIIGVCDNKYPQNSTELFHSYKTFNPQELKELDFDIIFLCIRDFAKIYNIIKYSILINTKNEDKSIIKLIKPTFMFYLKQLF